MMTSLDGYIEGKDHDLSWHHVDEEFNTFAIDHTGAAGVLIFGRKTYELMANYWPSEGLEDDPVVAKIMNTTPKIVFSRTLENVEETDTWKNVRLVRDNVKEEIQKLKNEDGKDLLVLGSNNLCVTLLQEGLLDEIRIMLNPVAIGQGTPLFKGIDHTYPFDLVHTRTFHNGNILLSYKPRE